MLPLLQPWLTEPPHLLLLPPSIISTVPSSLPADRTPSCLFVHALYSFHQPITPTVSLSYSFLLTLLYWQALLSLFLPDFSSLSSLSTHSPSDRHLLFHFNSSYKDSHSPWFFFSVLREMAAFLYSHQSGSLPKETDQVVTKTSSFFVTKGPENKAELH